MTNAIIRLLYGLFIGKDSSDYKEFFRKLFEQDNFQPQSIMTDFESGTIKSVREMLPNTLHQGKLSSTLLIEEKEIKIFPYRMSLPFFTSGMATSSK